MRRSVTIFQYLNRLIQRKIFVFAQFAGFICFPALVVAAPNLDFDHLQTGFELSIAHKRVECSQCHVNAVFEGTPRRCTFCHSSAGFIRGSSKPVRHLPTNEDCDACHTGRSWASARFDHNGVFDNCNRCHNGSSGTPKDSRHILSNSRCEDCHRTSSWIPVLRVDHGSVIGTCFSCHNGIIAQGVDNTTFPHGSLTQCDDCHNTNTFNLF